MQLYDCATAPSPRRVRIFLAEKAISIPTRQVDLRGGEQLRPAFRAINTDGTVPVLAFDDGSAIADAVAICCYREELQPEPALIGRTARERALTIACNRQLERDGFYAVMEAFRKSTPASRAVRCRARTTTSRSRRWPNAAARASIGFLRTWIGAWPPHLVLLETAIRSPTSPRL
jgi:glutathione S-transferase